MAVLAVVVVDKMLSNVNRLWFRQFFNDSSVCSDWLSQFVPTVRALGFRMLYRFCWLWLLSFPFRVPPGCAQFAWRFPWLFFETLFAGRSVRVLISTQTIHRLQENRPEIAQEIARGIYDLSILAQREVEPGDLEKTISNQTRILEKLTELISLP